LTKFRRKILELSSRRFTWIDVIELACWIVLFAWKLIVWLSRFPANSQTPFFRAVAWSRTRRRLFVAAGLSSLAVLAILPFHSRNFTWTLYRLIPGLPQELPAAVVAKQHLEALVNWTIFALIFAGIRAMRSRVSMVLETFDIVTAKNEWDGVVSVHVDTPLTKIRAGFVLRRVFQMTGKLASAPSVVRLEFHSPRLDDSHAAFSKRLKDILGSKWEVTSTPGVAMSLGASSAYRLLIKHGRRKPMVRQSRVLAVMVTARRIGGLAMATEALSCSAGC